MRRGLCLSCGQRKEESERHPYDCYLRHFDIEKELFCSPKEYGIIYTDFDYGEDRLEVLSKRLSSPRTYLRELMAPVGNYERKYWRTVKKTRRFHYCQMCGGVIPIRSTAIVVHVWDRYRSFPRSYYCHYNPHVELRYAERLPADLFRTVICQFTPEWSIPVDEVK